MFELQKFPWSQKTISNMNEQRLSILRTRQWLKFIVHNQYHKSSTMNTDLQSSSSRLKVKQLLAIGENNQEKPTHARLVSTKPALIVRTPNHTHSNRQLAHPLVPTAHQSLTSSRQASHYRVNTNSYTWKEKRADQWKRKKVRVETNPVFLTPEFITSKEKWKKISFLPHCAKNTW